MAEPGPLWAESHLTGFVCICRRPGGRQQGIREQGAAFRIIIGDRLYKMRRSADNIISTVNDVGTDFHRQDQGGILWAVCQA